MFGICSVFPDHSPIHVHFPRVYTQSWEICFGVLNFRHIFVKNTLMFGHVERYLHFHAKFR